MTGPDYKSHPTIANLEARIRELEGEPTVEQVNAAYMEFMKFHYEKEKEFWDSMKAAIIAARNAK